MRISDWSSDVCSSDLAAERKLTLQCLPAAEMRYTLDGTNPKEGTLYEDTFSIGPQAAKLMVYASAGEASRIVEFNIPSAGDKRSEERREGKECGGTCRSRWSPDP